MKLNNHKATIANYYDFQDVQDELYESSSKGKVFTNLMDLISSRENIELAYRAIKQNHGSRTSGTDYESIKDIAELSQVDYVELIQKSLENYKPKPVKRKYIPKPNGKLRPLGIPTITDRLVQQSMLQVLEPICEAKFYRASYGFRPNRSTEHAIAEVVRLMNRSHMQYVVDVDIKGFFDNVNHRKLMRQLWTMGIRDTKLLMIIKTMLKAPILLPDGSKEYPTKGTPQGGILSPLLANVVLNELDWWIASQWSEYYNVMSKPPKAQYSKNGMRSLGNEFKALRKTQLKEMYIVRYADDFKIFCTNRKDAVKIKAAVTDWLSHRLKLEVSPDKSGITNLNQHFSEFLGFKFKLRMKGKKSNGEDKKVCYTRMADKAVERATDKLIFTIKNIQHPENEKGRYRLINLYNSQVMGIQNYYSIANNSTLDFQKIQNRVRKIIKNRLNLRKPKEMRFSNKAVQERYGNSAQLKWVDGKYPIAPIGYCKSRNPMSAKAGTNQYTPEGRKLLFKPPDVDTRVMRYLMLNPVENRSIEYNDNRISLYTAQHGKCAVTGRKLEIGYIHCHHKTPKNLGGDDKYNNLVLLSDNVHRLVHSTKQETISLYFEELKLDKKQLNKLNKLRVTAGLEEIEM